MQDDDQANQQDQGTAPGVDQPSPAVPQGAPKCVTCGKDKSGEMCVGCNQGETSCTCQPEEASAGVVGGGTEGPSEPPVGGNPPPAM